MKDLNRMWRVTERIRGGIIIKTQWEVPPNGVLFTEVLRYKKKIWRL